MHTKNTTPTASPATTGQTNRLDHCPHCHSEKRSSVIRSRVTICDDCEHEEPVPQITVDAFHLSEFERAAASLESHNPDAAETLSTFIRNNVEGSRVSCAEYDEASTLYRQWLIHG